MAQISDLEFSVAMKVAAGRWLAADVENFLALDTEKTVVDPRVKKRIERKLELDKWEGVRQITAKTLKYAAIALVTAVSIFFGTTMSIRPVRAAFFGAIVTWYEDHIDVRYDGEDNNAEGIAVKKPTYVPDGWSITFEDTRNGLYLCDITKSDNGCIRFTQSKDLENGTGIDNDAYEQETVMLKEDTIEAQLFISEDGGYVLIWKDEYLFKLETENVEMLELIMIAESVK